MRQRRAATAALAMLVVGLTVTPADAGQNERPSFEVEARLMSWANVGQRQSVPDQNEAVVDFFVRRARVIAQARVTNRLRLYFQVGQDNIGAKLLTEDGSIRVKDAYANIRAANAFQVTVGQFKIPFLRANLESGFNQVLVDRATLPTLRPAREGSRDFGAMIWGNLDRLQYRVALFDGSDQEVRNSRSAPLWSARVAFNWFTNESGVGYTGSYLGTTRVLQIAGQVDVQGSRLDPRDESPFASVPRDYRAYALEAFFEQPLARAWAVTAEAASFNRQDDYLDPATATRRVTGYYAQAAILFPPLSSGRLQVAARREDWDSDRGSVGTALSRMTAGATYYVRGHNRKVVADYTRKQETPPIANDEFRLSMVVVF